MEEHIRTLIRHGAQIKAGEVLIPLTLGFYRRKVEECRTRGCKVQKFGLVLPRLEEFRFLLAIWDDGHVDSGCEDTIMYCLNMRKISLEER